MRVEPKAVSAFQSNIRDGVMSTGRFARQNRLLTPAQFKHVFAHAKKLSDRYITILVRPNQLPYSRLGLAIAKRNIKTAVARNRIKRIVRESFRLHQDEILGWDIVVMAKPVASVAENPQLFQSLETQWKKLAKFSENS